MLLVMNTLSQFFPALMINNRRPHIVLQDCISFGHGTRNGELVDKGTFTSSLYSLVILGSHILVLVEDNDIFTILTQKALDEWV